MMPEDIFLYQIQKAQEFINENSHADISRLHCLLRKIMPQEYHRWIDEIREKQSPTIFNIFGGTNTIASNAQLICEDIVGERALNQGYLHEIPYPFRPTGTLLQSFATNTFLQIRKFSEINIADPFFDSQRENYPEFDAWFKKKSEAGATAYTYFINGQLKDFLYLKIEDDVITDVKFKTFGCGSAIATSSMATELIKGKTLDEALELTNKAVVDALDGLPARKIHCSVLAEDAIKAAMVDYYERSGREMPESLVGFEPHED